MDKPQTHKQCNICFENKELKEFPSWWNRKKGRCHRPECRPCWAKKSYRLHKEKRMREDPLSWHQCDDDDCCNIWHVSRGEKCPVCGKEVLCEVP